MYSNSYSVESDGDLFKMQQEAIRRAREMSRAATLPPPPPPPRPPSPTLFAEPGQESELQAPKAEYAAPREGDPEALSQSGRGSLFGGLFGGKGLFGGGRGLFGGGKGLLGGLLSNLKIDDILLLVVLFLLVTERADDDIILIVAFLLIAGFLGD